MERDLPNAPANVQQSHDRSGKEAALFISRGQANQRERRIDSAMFTIGSGSDCDLVLGDDQFPELFAYVLRTHDGYRIRCLTPEPVLTVNAEDAIATRLEEGDRIRCGPYEFRFHQLAASPSRPADGSSTKLSSAAMSWIATDGQTQDGIAAAHRLIRDIRLRIDGIGQSTQSHRRSA
ncbi:FHA domain-containing protein [Bremerella cremea]|uniref:FHA domain-containing protein n=1 Tax=Bremerella cremea TaxID=1031537 RepID=UPI0031E6CD6D